MADQGWTWGDLAGELYARRIDPDTVSDREVSAVLDERTPERAADRISDGPTMAEYLSLPLDVRRYR